MARHRSGGRPWLWPSLQLALLIVACSASQEITHHISSPELPSTISPRDSQRTIPLTITNNCPENIWPAIATQAGTGPETGGFQLNPNTQKQLSVSADWQGRVWGRTNCSFNADGTGPSNLNGVNGGGQACQTGDCNGILDCVVTGEPPVTLFEIALGGGSRSSKSYITDGLKSSYDGKDYYDISLVDGYNLPMQVIRQSINGSDIGPDTANPSCVGADISDWCPWDLLLDAPTKPGDGVYPYPDDNIQRPLFCPCVSACAKSHSAQDCCTGSYNDPNICKPSYYSTMAKAVCPDAYSFAFDDQTSTFIITSGSGWEVVFCPAGHSTNILKTTGSQSHLVDGQNISLIQKGEAVAVMTAREKKVGSLGALVIMLAWACLW